MPTNRDEVGLVRAVAVKVLQLIHVLIIVMLINPQERSSSKRKEMWKTIQVKAGVARPAQLVLDMKVRWSSTLSMLDRAERNKTVSTESKCMINTDNVCSISILSLTSYAGKRLTA